MSMTEPVAPGADQGVLGRAFEVLSALVRSERGRLGVRELATAVGLPPSSTHRMLSMLTNVGMVTRNPDSTYSLGLSFFQLAARGSAKLSIRDIALPVLRELVASIDETALLALYEPKRRQLMFAVAVESTHPLRYFIPLNEWTPAYAGASGMAVCAWLSPEDRAAVFSSASPPLPHADFERRLQDLERVRRTGYAISHGQRIEGAVGIAAPIFDAMGTVVGTTALSIPEQRFEAAAQADIGQRVRAAAREVTHRIGGHAPTAPGGR